MPAVREQRESNMPEEGNSLLRKEKMGWKRQGPAEICYELTSPGTAPGDQVATVGRLQDVSGRTSWTG